MNKTPKITVSIPQFWEESVDDYHYFDYLADHYKKLGLKVKFEEIGHTRSYYQAIFWVGKKPTALIKTKQAEYGY